MVFYADLHIHSKFSRATSRDCDLEHLAAWAGRKGVTVVGTGDITHPGWRAELHEKLVPAEPGVFRLRDDLEAGVRSSLPPPCRGLVRFLLTVEISTIYKKNERTRKAHHVILVPGLEEAEVLAERLSKIGNLHSDGRPILGLDSRDLLEITLECGDGCYLIPAHIWTPWFSALGSKSGFDSIEECYDDLSEHIFAVETGLSSDPPMNWRVSSLDRYRLVSSSDAHSPPKIGREACVFDTDPEFWAIRNALATGAGYEGTVELFPEEGKYHADGHRKCGVCLTPRETKARDGLCPVCGKGLTLGVLYRVDELADRAEGQAPAAARPFRSLIPLPEILSELKGVGVQSKAVAKDYDELIARFGGELRLLERLPRAELEAAGYAVLGEAVARMREGRVIRQAGFDGEFGVIRLFEPGELDGAKGMSLLFDMPAPSGAPPPSPAVTAPVAPIRDEAAMPTGVVGIGPSLVREAQAEFPEVVERGILAGLDPEQRRAAEVVAGPLLIVAGPGTGKTRTLTHRMANLVANHGVAAEQCLAITFTRRAAAEMTERLVRLLPRRGRNVPVMTFHGLGMAILREYGQRLGLAHSFRVAGEDEQVAVARNVFDLSERAARRRLRTISRLKRVGAGGAPAAESAEAGLEAYEAALREQELVDFDDLIALPLDLFERDPDVLSHCAGRYACVSVDEYQDIDEQQYRLVMALVRHSRAVAVIGDPDQAIYGFRGTDVRLFQRFQEDFPEAPVVTLPRNYRSVRTIVDASTQAVAPTALVHDRDAQALRDDASRITIESCATERAEAEFIVHSVERMIGGHGFFSLDSGRVASEEGEELSFADFAVLYRTDAQADVLVEAFDRSGIPFQKRSHRALLDDPAARRVVERIREGDATGLIADRLAAALTVVAAEPGEDGAPGMDVQPMSDPLIATAARCGSDLALFLSELALGVDVDLWDPRADRVSLMTLHAAKGLEFRVVFIAGCEDGLLPLRWGTADESDAAEERRLFFVGMTRAKDRLLLCHARRRRWRGSVRDRVVSPFVKDIEEDLLCRVAGAVRARPSHRQLDLL